MPSPLSRDGEITEASRKKLLVTSDSDKSQQKDTTYKEI